MATVIDSLMVELGLDTKNFNTNQKKAVDDLKKFETQAGKTNKEVQKSTNDLTESFGKLGKNILALSGISLGLSGFRDFVADMTTGNAQLGRQSMLLGKSAQELSAWGAVAKSVGGSAEDMTQAMKNLQSQSTAIQMGRGNTSFMEGLARLDPRLLSEAVQTGSVDLVRLAEAMKRFSETFGVAKAKNIAEQLGLNETAFNLMLKGGDELRTLYDQMLKVTQGTNEASASAQKLQKDWAQLSQSASSLSTNLYNRMAPALDKTIRGMNALLQPASEAEAKAAKEGMAGKYGGARYRAGLTEKLWHKFLGGFNSADAAPAAVAPSSNASAPRNVRNNNPGNIEYGDFAKSMGATGSDGRFAIFPSMAAGSAAQEALLRNKYGKGLNTISKLIAGSGGTLGWLGGGKDLKDAASYIADVSKRTGIGADAPLAPSQLAAIQAAMAAHEGMVGPYAAMSGGKAANTTTVTIGELKVYTQATDGAGIAKDTFQALSGHSFIGAGIVGAN